MGAQQSTQVSQDSLYEILGVQKQATDLEIKKAYRKAALRLHPDKNPGSEEEVTKQFTRIQAAYDVLSDPQERAWYDSHGTMGDGPPEQEYGGNVTSTEELKQYMETELKGEEFFAKIGQLFGQLKREEAEAALDDGEEEPLLPDFGGKDANFDRHVKLFYDTWSSFNTIKSFAWEDVYRAWDAPDRRTRRAAEQRNKKIREAAKKEFNTAVRQLVNIIRTKDPRVKQNNKQKRNKPGNTAAKEQRKRDRQANASRRGEHVEQDWQQVDEEDENAYGEDGDEDDDLTIFECVVCDKTFKTKKQLTSHEASKKHAKALALLKREMRKEGVEFGFDELSSKDEKPEKKQEEVKQFPKAPSPEPEPEQEQPEVEENEESDESEKEVKKEKRRGNKPRIVVESSDSESEEDDSPLPEREPISKDATLDDLLSQLESTKVKDEPQVQVKGKAKQKRAKRAKQVNEFALRCSVCHAEYSSRNKLFEHVKASGHAAPISGGKKKKK